MHACKLPHLESGCCCRRRRRCPAASQQPQVASHGINGALRGGPDGQHCAAAGRHLCAACTHQGGRAALLQLQAHAGSGGCCGHPCCLDSRARGSAAGTCLPSATPPNPTCILHQECGKPAPACL